MNFYKLKQIFLILVFSLCSGCSFETNGQTKNYAQQYLVFLQVSNQSSIYKKRTQESCLYNPDALKHIAIICENLSIFQAIPNEKIDLIFLPYAQKYIEPQSLPTLSSYYRRKDIQEIESKIEKGIAYVTTEELQEYNKINSTKAGQQLLTFITDREMYRQIDVYVINYISSYLKMGR